MPPKSISVNSLIGKSRKEPSLSPEVNSIKPSDARLVVEVDTKLSNLESILGDDIKNFPFSESAFSEMIKLKVEQEKTKQDQIKLEQEKTKVYQIKLDIARKNHDIITTAMNANVPGHMIPSMCVTIDDNGFNTSRSNSIDYTNSSTNYKSNEITSNTSMSSNPSIKRPISPSRLGTQAVTNQTSPLTSYKFPNRMSIAHQRHYSMPVVKNANLTTTLTPNIDINRMDTQVLPHQAQHLSPYYPNSIYGHNYQYPPSRSSPVKNLPNRSHSRTSSLGRSSPATLQVKPLALNHKHNPPSQEAMTSFQRVIQFQHWNPENPGQVYQGQNPGISGISSERNHKRHKSHIDNMSVDLGSQTIKEDVSMEYENKK